MESTVSKKIFLESKFVETDKSIITSIENVSTKKVLFFEI